MHNMCFAQIFFCFGLQLTEHKYDPCSCVWIESQFAHRQYSYSFHSEQLVLNSIKRCKSCKRMKVSLCLYINFNFMAFMGYSWLGSAVIFLIEYNMLKLVTPTILHERQNSIDKYHRAEPINWSQLSADQLSLSTQTQFRSTNNKSCVASCVANNPDHLRNIFTQPIQPKM